jgi:hypothetical protein
VEEKASRRDHPVEEGRRGRRRRKKKTKQKKVVVGDDAEVVSASATMDGNRLSEREGEREGSFTD